MIDPREDIPAWREVADDLRRRIESGELAPDSMLRAEADLAHDYDVGNRTIRQAVRDLAADGVLYLRAGMRAVVRRRHAQVVQVLPGSFLTVRRPTRQEQRDMQLSPTARVVEVTRGDDPPQVYDAPVTLFSFDEQ